MNRITNQCWLFFLIAVFIANHELQAQTGHPNRRSIPKGHQLYKMTKIYDAQQAAQSGEPVTVPDDAVDRANYEFDLLRNPHTNEIPENITALEKQFAEKSSKGQAEKFGPLEMGPRGPFNVGGRTRALAIDRTNENVILAGGVSGGLYRSEDAGATWRRITTQFQHPSITCIVQDPRPGRERIWYYGTGEAVGNSASATGALFEGNGIYRSFNGGRSFWPSRSTTNTDVNTGEAFDFISNIAVHPVTGHVYASTLGGVFKSTNLGRDFSEVIASEFPNWTDVIVTTSGVLYASVEATSPLSGIYTSTDGDNWTDITPAGWFPSTGRTVMGYAPSSENILYTLSEDTDGGLGFLWEYNADSVLSAAWIDLSPNLPNLGGPVGSLNTQTSYNLVVKVHPTNPNLVFVGGTNLYRSTTAFRTPAGQESWIGGYSPLNDVSLYTNQHPDQHNLLFYPSDPNRALSANDGGVYLAEDITENSPGIEPVTWIDLNNGYLTTQPYVVSIDPQTESEDLVSGFQDNGTWFTNATELETPWTEDFGGDGSFAAIADGGRTRYVSFQRGGVFRLNFDENGVEESFTRVQPAGASGFRFIAPFILDPNEDNIMYMPAGGTMWRNNNLDQIPLFSNSPTSVNWVEMTETSVTGTITALDVSTYPVANRLFYGTNQGEVYRMDNANLDGQVVTNVTGEDFPEGNIVCVTVDPTNSDEVFAIFSNYGIPSVFYSDNAGDSWVDISGNLEENPDGSGNGPSIRWLAVEGNSEGYYLGTSIGLYYARRIRPNSQRWNKRFRSNIGEQVVPMVKTRGDGFVAVAVHGNGLYSGFDVVEPRPEAQLSVAFLLDDISVDVNAPDTTISVAGLFQQAAGAPIDVSLVNSNPGIVSAVLNGDDLELSFTPDTTGFAGIGLVATSGNETVSEGLGVTVARLPFFEQSGAATTQLPSQNFLDFGAVAQTAADFVVPAGEMWTIDSLSAPGVANNSPQLTAATVVIYADDNGVPGAEVYNSGSFAPGSPPSSTTLGLNLPTPVALGSGTYWLSVYADLPFFPDFTQWFWDSQDEVVGQESFFRDQFDLFGLGATDWTPVTQSLRPTAVDQIFQFFGLVTVPETDTNLERSVFLGESELASQVKVWPNPSASGFQVSLPDSESPKVISIYDLQGNIILERSLEAHQLEFVWDASRNSSGLYMIRVHMDGGSKAYTVLKR